MTAMMARNATTVATLKEELQDVSDIAAAAGTSLSALVRCLVNTKANRSDHVRQLVERALEPHVPALTVVEMGGEYDGMFNFSISCQAVLPTVPTREFQLRGTAARAVVAGSLMHLSVSARNTTLLLTQAAALAHEAGAAEGDDWLSPLLECTIFARSAEDVCSRGDGRVLRCERVRARRRDVSPLLVAPSWQADILSSALSVAEAPPSLLALQAPASGGDALSLSCTSLVASAVEKKRAVRTKGDYAVVADEFVYATLGAALPNASNAFEALGELLRAAGSTMENVVSCHFYMRAQPAEGYPKDLFAGFMA
eukprot:3707979-Prymnesium_polylepis.1